MSTSICTDTRGSREKPQLQRSCSHGKLRAETETISQYHMRFELLQKLVSVFPVTPKNCLNMWNVITRHTLQDYTAVAKLPRKAQPRFDPTVAA